ncbi:MAG: VIT1/CCC1 transporter family protein [Spirochaetota bacterium]
MKTKHLDPEILDQIKKSQKNEITEHRIYSKISRSIKDEENRKILQQIGNDELEHSRFWKTYTGREIHPSRWKIIMFFLISKILGLTFSIKLMEKAEEAAQIDYQRITRAIPEAEKIVHDEEEHEAKLISLVQEERLNYMGSIVLGLNDALVELTGALAGLTFALQNTRLIALAGLITGVAASFSMAASEYLSTKAEGGSQSAGKSSLYTGIAYICTVIVLVLPYLIFSSYLVCLSVTIAAALLIILFFNFYISVAKDLVFIKRFSEMAGVSMGVALVSFGIGYLIRIFLGVEV